LIEVKLTGAELLMAAGVGVSRNLVRIKKGSIGKNNQPPETYWQSHIEGALGECAVAKHLNVFWSAGVIRGPDVFRWDVRTTSKHSNRLILQPDDDDEKVFFHVTGVNGAYRIHGWIYGHEGKQKAFWEDPRKEDRWAFFVPNDFPYCVERRPD
jgi:hypothetical protein